MKQIPLSTADFGVVDFEKAGVEAADVPGLEQFLLNYRPRYINHSSERYDGSIPLVFRDQKKQLHWNGSVGVFRMLYPQDQPKYDLNIRSYSGFDTKDKHYFLAALLQSWLENSGNSANFDDMVTGASWDEIFDFMSVAVFRRQLMDAYETGIYRGYQYFEDNSDRLRGSIDVSRHIRLNLGMRNGKIAMRYRKNTPDNAMNHLILHTYDELKQRHPGLVSALIVGDACGAVLENLRYLAPSYSKTEPVAVAAKLRQPISNPLYDTYELLRGTCLHILEEQGVPVFEEGEERENTILFYSPDLWENFIDHRILSRLTGIKLETQLRLLGFHEQMELRPDFVLFGGIGRIVLDAKYKKEWGQFPSIEGLKDDIRQCLVYQTAVQAAYSGIIFPAQKRKKDGDCKTRFSQFDHRKDGSFRVFDVLLPQDRNSSYQHWREALDAEEAHTAGCIDALFRELEAQ